MKRFQKVGLAIVTLFLFSFVPISDVFADTPPIEYDYTVFISNSDLVFVMLARTYAPENPEIRALYPKSGLYNTAGEAPKALWTVDWYAFNVELSTDGKHLIRWGPWPSSPSQIAVEFYTDGALTQSYKIDRLVRKPESLPHSVSHFTWKKDARFNQVHNELFVETLNHEKYLFDVSTGQLLQGTLVSESESDQSKLILLIKIFAAFALFIVLLIGSIRIFQHE